MEIKTSIEIQTYGDFDMLSTDYIMVSENSFDEKKLTEEFCADKNLEDISYLHRDDVNLYITFLKRKGFKVLKTNIVAIGGSF